MKQLLITSLLSILHLVVCAQKEDYQWILNFTSVDDCEIANFPEACGASILDFNVDPPAAIRNQKAIMDLDWTNASICDSTGQLLFYSNNMRISNGDHEVVPNGDTISYGRFWDRKTWPNENGVMQPAGFSHSGAAVFIANPGHASSYYHIYCNYDNRQTTGFQSKYYAKLELNNAEYEVVEKDQVITDLTRNPGHATCCQHANGRDWWLLQFSDDTVSSYLIDPTGIYLSHQEVMPFGVHERISSAVFNPSGTQFAAYQVYQSGIEEGAELVIYDFDRCTGRLSNQRVQIEDSFDHFATPGIEFSPSGRYLYTNSRTVCNQYDTWSDDIFATRETVMLWDSSAFYNPSQTLLKLSTFGLMRRGPDDKIYLANTSQNTKMHIIHKPNEAADSCHPEQNGITLPTYVLGTIPTFPTLRLGPLDGSSCDTLGLDNHPVSRFRYEQDTVDYLSLDFLDQSYFEPSVWEWDFGDGNNSTLRFPTHSYTEDGAYRVCLTVSNEYSTDTSCDSLYLGASALVETKESRYITLFPNPVEDYARVAFHDYLPQAAHIRIYDQTGHYISKITLGGTTTLIDLSGLSSGIYMYEIYDVDVRIGSGKFVKLDI